MGSRRLTNRVITGLSVKIIGALLCSPDPFDNSGTLKTSQTPSIKVSKGARFAEDTSARIYNFSIGFARLNGSVMA